MNALRLERPGGSLVKSSFTDSLADAIAGRPILLLVSVYILSCLTVVDKLDTPILNWRPTDMASISLNYYRNGFQFLFPQIYWGGNGPGYVEMEFPVIPFINAVLYGIFGVHEWLCLIIPWLSGLGIMMTVYRFGSMLFDRTIGLLAGVFVAASPTFLDLSTGLWPDPPMVFFGTLGLLCLARWSATGKWRSYLAGAAFVSLAILIKLTALYLGLLIIYLSLSRYGVNWWRIGTVWLLAFIILLPPFLWYLHAYTLFVDYHNTFGILSSGYLKFATFDELSSFSFYKGVAYKFMMYQLTPFVFLMFLIGLAGVLAKRSPQLLLVWLGVIAFYIIVVAKGVWGGHHQYLLPLLPPAAITAAAGTVWLKNWISAPPWSARLRTLRQFFLSFIIVLVVASSAMGRHLYKSKDIFGYPIAEKRKETGLVVAHMTEPSSLIIVTDTQMDDVTPERSMTPPDVFYFSDRRGWYLSMAWLTPELIEKFRNEGARYFVVTSYCTENFVRDHYSVMQHLAGRYKTVLHDARGIIYDMQQQ